MSVLELLPESSQPEGVAALPNNNHSWLLHASSGSCIHAELMLAESRQLLNQEELN